MRLRETVFDERRGVRRFTQRGERVPLSPCVFALRLLASRLPGRVAARLPYRRREQRDDEGERRRESG